MYSASLGHISKSGIVGLCGNSIFNFLRKLVILNLEVLRRTDESMDLLP